MDTHTEQANITETTLNALESLRKRLLDLSGRNRLLNFRHSQRGSLRVIDELPDHLYAELLGDIEMRFGAVPEPRKEQLIEAGYLEIDPETGEENRLHKEPSARDWAGHLGFSIAYELPTPIQGTEALAHHQDKTIQTLLYPHELEAVLRHIRSQAETVIEEIGTNVLYLAFGFLEWFESRESRDARLAPLLLLPVKLERGRLNTDTETYEYTLHYSGEDIAPNLSLREKLRLDFGLALPELDDSETPEKYFNKVSRLIKQQPNWTVRRYVSLSLFNFGKLLMYLDLDPKRWPAENSLVDHPVVRQFFSGAEGEGSDFATEYPIDTLSNIHVDFPLIEDADSSQHSALIDAVSGKNLVIEGPPGTGKSQTITNLIAAALAKGKKVLFVAEKLAALEVVKRRLDKAGLGDFCLELHSHKSQKRQILDAIAARIANQESYQSPNQINDLIALYESARKRLSDHVERINVLYKATGRTIHEILMGAVHYRQISPFPPSAVAITRPISGSELTPVEIRQDEELIETYQLIAEHIRTQLPNPDDRLSHPWAGVTNQHLQPYDLDQVLSALTDWRHALDMLQSEGERLAATLEAPLPSSIRELTDFITNIAALPPLQGDESIECLPALTGDGLNALRTALDLYQEIQSSWKELEQVFRREYLEDLGELRKAGGQLATVIPCLAQPDGSFEEFLVLNDELQVALADLANHMPLVQEVSEQFHGLFPPNLRGLEDFTAVATCTAELDPALLKLRDGRFDDDEIDPVLADIQERIGALQSAMEVLTLDFLMDQLPPVETLRMARAHLSQTGVFRWLNSNWRRTRRETAAILRSPTRLPVEEMLCNLDDLLVYLTERTKFENDFGHKKALGDHFRGLDTDIQALQQLRNWYRQIRQRFGAGFGGRARLADIVLDMPVPLAKGFHALHKQGVIDHLQRVISVLKTNISAFSDAAGIDETSDLTVSASGWIKAAEALAHTAIAIRPQVRDTELPLTRLQEYYEQADRLAALVEQWLATAVIDELTEGRLNLSVGFDADPQIAEQASRLLALAESLQQSEPAVRAAVMRQPSHEYLEVLRNAAAAADQVRVRHAEFKQIFTSLVDLDESQWFPGGKTGGFSTIRSRMGIAVANSEYLSNWLGYQRSRHRLAEAGLSVLAEKVECGQLATDDLVNVYHCVIFDRLSREILIDTPALAEFSGKSQEALQQQFRKYDEKLKHLQRQRIAYQASLQHVPPGRSGGKVSQLTEKALLNHEIGKKKRHVPIRQLVARAGNALAALKPCFMMGPMSVAQYLQPGQIEFDLIVMDEASQMKPEDALGAIARGKQVVIVGDPKQLPPTNFFNKLIDNEESEEITAIEDSESILDAAIPLFQPMRRLRWHYRSRHESLIAFSNHAFYRGDLVVFPSPYSVSAEFGVKFSHIKGRFIGRRNSEEARAIAMAAVNHLLHCTDESIGIVAMNAEQRDQIEVEIEGLLKDNPLAQSAYDRNQVTAEPLFVKNLENVQGDERDVIYISFTYGPLEVGSKVPQRFGPINGATGWRRLNVLFTRAKKRMHVFASMTKNDILVNEGASLGLRALRDFLAFAETGCLHQLQETGRQPDSLFEISVAHALRETGFESVAQVGVAGYFIDMAVKDPGQPGRYLLGIECDGATYHSAKSARDRDRLRQTVLEQLGWRIHRIWSTDWFKNPAAEIKSLIPLLNELKTEAPTEAAAVVVKPAILPQLSTPALSTVEVRLKPEAMSLRNQLVWFDENVVRPAFPNTSREKRLLRPSMIEALLEYTPETKAEFVESIPAYLRQATDVHEARQLLQQVLDIIVGELETPHATQIRNT